MTDGVQITFEIVKLVAQGSVAFYVARRAVDWALARYKSEKIWERRLSAYVDLISALSEMQRINEAWIEEEETYRSSPEEYRKAQSIRYSDARRKVEEVSALARLLLPATTVAILDQMHAKMSEETPDMSYYERLDIDGYALRVALEALISEGRAVSDIDRG